MSLIYYKYLMFWTGNVSVISYKYIKPWSWNVCISYKSTNCWTLNVSVIFQKRKQFISPLKCWKIFSVWGISLFFIFCSQFFSTNIKSTLKGHRMNYKFLLPPLYPKLANEPRHRGKDEEDTWAVWLRFCEPNYCAVAIFRVTQSGWVCSATSVTLK